MESPMTELNVSIALVYAALGMLGTMITFDAFKITDWFPELSYRQAFLLTLVWALLWPVTVLGLFVSVFAYIVADMFKQFIVSWVRNEQS
jgi:hypothetical protein